MSQLDDEDEPPFRASPILGVLPKGRIELSGIAYLSGIISVVLLSSLVLFYARPFLTYTRILYLANPALLGSLTFLIGLLARNVSISDRIRFLGKEVNDARAHETPPSLVRSRLKSIRSQLFSFRSRYKLNVYSLVAIAGNLLMLPLIAFSIPPEFSANTEHAVANSIQLNSLTFLFLLLSSCLYSFAGFSCIVDVLLSIKTIETDIRHSVSEIDLLKNEPDEIDEGEVEVVVHFSRLFHELWNRTRLEIETMPDENNSRQNRVANFFSEYVGLHSEAFHFFANGLIPESLYRRWVIFLRDQALERSAGSIQPVDKDFCGTNLRKWWDSHRTDFPDPEFQLFIDRVFYNLLDDRKKDKPSIFTIPEILALIPRERLVASNEKFDPAVTPTDAPKIAAISRVLPAPEDTPNRPVDRSGGVHLT